VFLLLPPLLPPPPKLAKLLADEVDEEPVAVAEELEEDVALTGVGLRAPHGLSTLYNGISFTITQTIFCICRRTGSCLRNRCCSGHSWRHIDCHTPGIRGRVLSVSSRRRLESRRSCKHMSRRVCSTWC
jgi:hypothetical protein